MSDRLRRAGTEPGPTRTRCRLVAALLAGCLAAGSGFEARAEPGEPIEPALTPALRATVLSHGPWPPTSRPDPSNRASGSPDAIALGARLFFDPRLSRDGTQSCASCHEPRRHFADGVARATVRERLDRNTPTVVNLSGQRWFGWDGAADSLWAQSIRPILSAAEMASSTAAVGALVRGDRQLACALERVFGGPVGGSGETADEAVLVQVGKALAAYQETLVTGRSAFDEFRDALERGDSSAMARYPADARRGLLLFAGRGRCSLCHFGPGFTNGEFADAGVPYFIARGRVDRGRYGGIQSLRASPYNLLGPYNDDPTRATAAGTRHVILGHRNFGEFKVPSLRGASRTAPYMHDGSLPDLPGVVRHYSELDQTRLHADGERILRPLGLSRSESEDLVAFLRSLDAPLAPGPDPSRRVRDPLASEAARAPAPGGTELGCGPTVPGTAG